MQFLTYGMMTNAVPPRRAAMFATLTAYGLNAAATRAATIDTASLTVGPLLDAIAPNLAEIFSETLTGVLKIIGYGYVVLFGVLLAATLCRGHRFARLSRQSGRARVADAGLRRQVGAVR